jgi:hypothetical protein
MKQSRNKGETGARYGCHRDGREQTNKQERAMTDRSGLQAIGYLFGSVTAVVMLLAGTVVYNSVGGEASANPAMWQNSHAPFSVQR